MCDSVRTTVVNPSSSVSKSPPKSEASPAISNPTSYIPLNLRPYVAHHFSDFYVTPYFSPPLTSILMYEGFLPIANRRYMLPKLHEERCVVPLNNVKFSKSVRKKANKWNLTINTAFDDVIKGCHNQHGEAWLYPKMVRLLQEMFKNNDNCSMGVQIISVELWKIDDGNDMKTNEENNDTVPTLGAGELGYAIGGIYTSLTGFNSVDSAGTIQLLALAGLLKTRGFELWDLGMEMEYKMKMGAVLLERDIFLEKLRRLRGIKDVVFDLETGKRGYNARTLIDFIK